MKKYITHHYQRLRTHPNHWIRKTIGVLLMIGCFGYLIDAFTFIVAPERELTLAQYLFWGEVALPLWLLIRGVNVARWTEQAQAAAAAH